jgi:hypothetical protein
MNLSILVMLAAPYLLFAGICGLLVHAVRKARRLRSRADEVTGSDTPDDASTGGPSSDLLA